MKRSALFTSSLFVAACLGGLSCSSGGSGDCGLPGQWSVANSGDLCQANLFGDTQDYAVYCVKNSDGDYQCACGAVSENPAEFISTDFCDLKGEARACKAIELCNFPL